MSSKMTSWALRVGQQPAQPTAIAKSVRCQPCRAHGDEDGKHRVPEPVPLRLARLTASLTERGKLRRKRSTPLVSGHAQVVAIVAQLSGRFGGRFFRVILLVGRPA
jgi:hypothetical protein